MRNFSCKSPASVKNDTIDNKLKIEKVSKITINKEITTITKKLLWLLSSAKKKKSYHLVSFL